MHACMWLSVNEKTITYRIHPHRDEPLTKLIYMHALQAPNVPRLGIYYVSLCQVPGFPMQVTSSRYVGW